MTGNGPADDPLGAFCRHDPVRRDPTRPGPLSGLTFGAKDSFDVAGVPTCFGSPDWLGTHPVPTRTAPAVQALLDAGARLVGKTQCDELTYSLNGENAHYGTPINPRAPGRIPGGSSSGSAAAVAGGLCDFTLGSDTGGSVRLPASYCGVWGMRPTHGRIALEGACPLAPSFDTAGWFAGTPELLERVGRVLLGDSTEPVRPLRLLIARDAFDLLSPPVAAALEPAVRRAAESVGTAADVRLAPEGLA
ncbi:MAG: amidase, partial [Chloroflexi bacterium]|nr:amidase [Chloroflexota bacterium]